MTFFMAFALLAVRPSMNAEAAGGYTMIDNNGKVTRAGGRYFRQSGGSIYYGSSSSDVSKWAVCSDKLACTNGKTIYYIDDAASGRTMLMKYSISSAKTSVLRRLDADDDWHVSAVYGRNVYLSRFNYSTFRSWIYMYSTGTRKIRRIASQREIYGGQGSYVYICRTWGINTRGYQLSVYKLTSRGMKKVRLLGNYCSGPWVIKGKLYYVKYPSPGRFNSAALYRAGASGADKVKLGSFSRKSIWGDIDIYDVSSKKCTVHFGDTGRDYTYTYKTKTLKAY